MGDQATGEEDVRHQPFNKKAIFMITVGSVASVVSFGYTFLQSKKSEIKEITSQHTPQEVRKQMALLRNGTKMASKALAYSWMLSIGGVSLLSYAAWKLSGARNLNDFRQKAGDALPIIPKSEVQGRNDFHSLKDLADYLEEEDARAKHLPCNDAS
ncbi:transmembrane protein 242-like [Watersipora subatra]|uniref:transmembrane protein 242-like n=1 Tax=Watersipora subatra TaxID=2589382 RepID=UPI00355B5BAB